MLPPLIVSIHLYLQDKRLFQLRYMALTKSERVRYKAAKKLTHYIVCLLRIKAVEHVHGEEAEGGTVPKSDATATSAHTGVEKLLMEPVPTSFEVPNRQLWHLPKHPMSATTQRHHPSTKAPPPRSANKPLPILSAGAKRTGGCSTQLQLPVNTLRDSLKFIGAMHSLVGTLLTHKSKNNSMTLSEVFERVKQLLKNSVVEGDEQWNLHSFCFKCGQCAGVQLTRCSGCGLVSFCSQHCKDECWRSGHRLECPGSTHVHRKPAAKETKLKSDQLQGITAGKITISLSLSLSLSFSLSLLVHPALRNVHHHSVSDSKYHSVSGEYKQLTAVASQRIKSSIAKFEHLTTILNSSA